LPDLLCLQGVRWDHWTQLRALAFSPLRILDSIPEQEILLQKILCGISSTLRDLLAMTSIAAALFYTVRLSLAFFRVNFKSMAWLVRWFQAFA